MVGWWDGGIGWVMVWLNRLHVTLACSAAALPACWSPEVQVATPTVILVSLDGFRWDFREVGNTPTLDSLAEVGVTAERMIPVFPTMTFPSHYSMATGLYPERHGIVSNRMYDPARDTWFAIGNRDAAWWGGEPIWLTAERQGIIAATFFWPGTDVPINGRHATYWYGFDASIPNEDRVDQVLEWIALPTSEQPQLITLYFEDVDQAAHDDAIGSRRVQSAIASVDAALGRLTAGIAHMGASDKVNIIIVSDHGMAERSPERVIFIDDFVDIDSVTVVDWNPVWMASAIDGNHDGVYQRLHGVHPNLTAYLREDVPERFHFKNNARVPPVIAIADEGWSITTRSYFDLNRDGFRGHTHGYDNNAASMAGVFVATGPAFANGKIVDPFENVHLYALLCHILGIEPAPNDGNLDAIRKVLRPSTIDD